MTTRAQFLRQHPAFAATDAHSPERDQFLRNHPEIAAQWRQILQSDGSLQQAASTIGRASTVQYPFATPTGSSGGSAATGGSTPAPTGYDALDGASRDWVDELTNVFRSHGLESLAGTLTQLVQGGYAGPALTLALQDSEPYKQRFSANAAREKAGLRVLSPSEYLAAEDSYRQIMQTAGLPAGFYDTTDDFTKFLANDTSPQELQGRVQDYVQVAKNTDSGYRKMIADTFGVGLTDGDIAAFMIDPSRALPLLEKTVNSIGVADAARRNNLSYSADRANQLTELGVTADQASQQYGQIAEATSAYGRAAAAYGDQYDQTTAEDESLLGLASAKRKREKVQGEFEAYNSGSSKTSLSRDTTGSY